MHKTIMHVLEETRNNTPHDDTNIDSSGNAMGTSHQELLVQYERLKNQYLPLH